MYNRRIAARGIIYKDGKLFAIKHVSSKFEHDTDYWCTPGGGLDDGEPITDCLKREMIEETGIVPEIGKLLFVQQFSEKASGREQMEFFFHITNTSDFERIDLASTTHGAIEIEKFEFIDPQSENLLPLFLRDADYESVISGALPTQVFNYLS